MIPLMWTPQTVLGTLCPFLRICFWEIIRRVILSPWTMCRFMAVLTAQLSWLPTCLRTTRGNRLVSNTKPPLVLQCLIFNHPMWYFEEHAPQYPYHLNAYASLLLCMILSAVPAGQPWRHHDIWLDRRPGIPKHHPDARVNSCALRA